MKETWQADGEGRRKHWRTEMSVERKDTTPGGLKTRREQVPSPKQVKSCHLRRMLRVGRAELPPSAHSGSKCQVFKVAEDGSSFRACHQICEGGPVVHPATPTSSPTLHTFRPTHPHPTLFLSALSHTGHAVTAQPLKSAPAMTLYS